MGIRFGFVSTFPPTQCGLATFTSALRDALLRTGDHEGRVVQLVESVDVGPADAAVVARLLAGDAGSVGVAAAQLNQCDAVILQHEYGVYGGTDGDQVLDLLDQIRVPRIVVLHTVLSSPTRHQRQVLEAVVAKADALVTMTATAADRLAAGYAVDMRKVTVIAHGAADLSHGSFGRPQPDGAFTLLTWGLLGPGKGLEWAIEAMNQLRDLHPMPRYVIAGQTHPKVLAHQGEAYRDRLREQVRRSDLEASVRFDGAYRDSHALAGLIRSADVIVLPYDSTEQVTSGVLIEAVAAGKPVVATEFPHARELLSNGAGMLVPHRDPAALAVALRTVVTEPGRAAAMARAASESAPRLLWPAVADQYTRLAERLILTSVAA